MRILLSPDIDGVDNLRDVYLRAFRDAEELYIASAYLTDWDHRYKLSSRCKRAVFVAGTDFGLTRKAALRDVLRWMPKRNGFFFGAISEKGFHPKIVAWKTRLGRHYCIVGSSNLSRAAFSGNREANVFSAISTADYERIRDWIEGVATVPVTVEWIDNHYEEAKRAPGGKPPSTRIVHFQSLPNSKRSRDAVIKRRKTLPVFARSRERLRKEMSLCAKQQSTDGNRDFWHFFWRESDKWRFQRGTAIAIYAKHANWGEFCTALLGILDASTQIGTARLDHIVREEIDHLARNKNPLRRAWLSEMLCHYLPQLYPVDNDRMQKWLSQNKWPSRRGLGKGQYYIELAQKLREVVKEHHPSGAKNLAELDATIVSV
jgi:hypothetical protein